MSKLSVSSVVAFGVSSLTALAQTPVHHFVGTPLSSLGQSVANPGDVDGDGVPDILVGAPEALDPSGVKTGRVVLYSGSTGAVLREWFGISSGEYFGRSVAGAGDVDVDGIPDLVVGSPNATSFAGYARVLSGASGAVLHHFAPAAPNSHFGRSVDGLGDVDGDGAADLIVGAYDESVAGIATGTVRVFSGSSGSVLHFATGSAANDAFGISVASVGDVDADGRHDFVVGAEQWPGFLIGPGYARLFSGATGQAISTFIGDGVDDGFGGAVAGAGDVNADGRPDFIIGAYGAANPPLGSFSGEAKVYSGLDGSLLHALHADTGDEMFGFAVDGVGDVNGDGHDDFIIGVRYDSGVGLPAFTGGAHVYSGKVGTELFGVWGSVASENFGWSVCGAGDVDQDGRPDFTVGAPYHAGGNVYVYGSCPTATTSVGSGCPGSGGFTSALAIDGCVDAGATVTLTVTKGLGGAFGILFLGSNPVAIPLPSGCVLRVDPVVTILPFMLGGAGPGTGSIALPVQVPGVLTPFQVVLQAFVADGALLSGYSVSNGVVVKKP